MLLNNLPAVVVAIMVTIIPYTPINLIIFLTVLLMVLGTNVFGWASDNKYICRYNQLEKSSERSLWAAIKNTYYVYFILAFIINMMSITDYKSFNLSMITAARPSLTI
jgi:hypothetical protein